MKVVALAFACYVYGRMTGYDKSYLDFKKAVSDPPDLTNRNERLRLIVWLNQWGCRQFAKEYHNTASDNIGEWFRKYGPQLSQADKNLQTITIAAIDEGVLLFEALSSCIASERASASGQREKVTIGPTGASKILFALRPSLYPPWDMAIREELHFDGASSSYRGYMVRVKEELAELESDCERLGLSLDKLPSLVGRPDSTPVKMIDEYFWVTISNKCPVPESEVLSTWASWT